jgi:hypothetical protein
VLPRADFIDRERDETVDDVSGRGPPRRDIGTDGPSEQFGVWRTRRPGQEDEAYEHRQARQQHEHFIGAQRRHRREERCGRDQQDAPAVDRDVARGEAAGNQERPAPEGDVEAQRPGAQQKITQDSELDDRKEQPRVGLGDDA